MSWKEEKVVVFRFKIRVFPINNIVGVGDYHAFGRLAENGVQRYGRKDIRAEEVMKNVSCTNGRKLVAVADHNKAAVEGKGTKKRIKKKGVHHGHLVHNKGVAFERILFVSSENRNKLASGIINFQKAVDGFGFVAGKFRKTLCGSSGGRRKQNFVALLFKKFYQRVKSCGFAGAGASGKDKNMVLNGVPKGAFLKNIIFYTKLFLKKFNGFIKGGGRLFFRTHKHHFKPSGGGSFRKEKGRKINISSSVSVIFVKFLFLNKFLKSISHFFRFAKKPGCRRQKTFFRKAGVAVIKVMNKNVFDSRFKAALVMRVAFFGENCVRLGKFKADFRVAKKIGVVFYEIDGVCAPFFPGANSNGGRKAEILQSGHNFSCTESTKIFGIYFKGKFFRNAFDSCEFKRCVFNDFKSIFAESFDNSLCKGGADPLKRTAGKIFADSGCGSGKSSLANVRAELGSIGRMGRESAGEGNFLAGFNFAKLANNRNKLALHIKIKHNETAFGFVSNNSVNGAAYFLRFLFFVFFGHASFSVLNNKYIIVFFYLFVNLP